jgi:hypothetical protein
MECERHDAGHDKPGRGDGPQPLKSDASADIPDNSIDFSQARGCAIFVSAARVPTRCSVKPPHDHAGALSVGWRWTCLIYAAFHLLAAVRPDRVKRSPYHEFNRPSHHLAWTQKRAKRNGRSCGIPAAFKDDQQVYGCDRRLLRR